MHNFFTLTLYVFYNHVPITIFYTVLYKRNSKHPIDMKNNNLFFKLPKSLWNFKNLKFNILYLERGKKSSYTCVLISYKWTEADRFNCLLIRRAPLSLRSPALKNRLIVGNMMILNHIEVTYTYYRFSFFLYLPSGIYKSIEQLGESGDFLFTLTHTFLWYIE